MKVNDIITYTHMKGYIYLVVRAKIGVHTVRIVRSPRHGYDPAAEYTVKENMLPFPPKVLILSLLEYIIYGVPYEI